MYHGIDGDFRSFRKLGHCHGMSVTVSTVSTLQYGKMEDGSVLELCSVGRELHDGESYR